MNVDEGAMHEKKAVKSDKCFAFFQTADVDIVANDRSWPILAKCG